MQTTIRIALLHFPNNMIQLEKYRGTKSRHTLVLPVWLRKPESIMNEKNKGNELKMLDTPLKEMFCSYCKQSVAPGCQVRLSAEECGQKTDIIAWTCSNCEYEHATPDDVSILSAEIIEI